VRYACFPVGGSGHLVLGVVVGVLRLGCHAAGAGFVVDLAVEGVGARRSASARLEMGLSGQDREDLRWYLEVTGMRCGCGMGWRGRCRSCG
jgi:hypothetical protein